MNNTICTALNQQINKEFFSSYLYLSMAAFFENQNLKGFANWMRVQAKEENDHAMGLYNHLLERGGKVELGEIKKPSTDFKDILNIFEETLIHEQNITKKIHELYELSTTEKDFALQSFLKWYVDEQVEEEANAQELIDKVKILGGKGEALYLLDRELSARVYVPATILTK
ncbi:MAG TPA: ferritin [Candidatus Magasanikbacteria bacterium]|nr:ferritin [Candidatus Magasanikbacteria bacterium]